jgi:hypothetical protein
MKKLLLALLIVTMTTATGFAFGIPKLSKQSGGAPAVTMDQALKTQNDLVAAYVAGKKYDLETKAMIAEALGLREEAAVLMTASESISEGNVQDIPATQAKTEEAQQAMEEKMADSKELSKEAQIKVGESLLCLTKSVLNYKKAVDLSHNALDSAQSVVKSSSPTEVFKVKKQLNPVLTIAPKLPDDLVSVAETSSRYVAFAKTVGVEPPADLESALGNLE